MRRLQLERVEQEAGEIRALCALCQQETPQLVLITGRPRLFGFSPVHDVRRYRFCRECGARQTIPEDPPRSA